MAPKIKKVEDNLNAPQPVISGTVATGQTLTLTSEGTWPDANVKDSQKAQAKELRRVTHATYLPIAAKLVELGFTNSKNINFPLLKDGQDISISRAIIALSKANEDMAILLIEDMSKFGPKMMATQLINAVRIIKLEE